jgi:phytol kinase
MIRVAVAALCYTALFILIELITRKLKLNRELSRKLAHIIAGTSAAFLPLLMSFYQIMVLSLLFLPVMAISKRRNLFSSIHQVNRKTYGELYFPIAIFITAWWFPTKDLFMYGVLVMGISDGLASIVGQRLGLKTYKLWQGKKSYVGSFTFFVSTTLIGILVMPAVGLAPLAAIAILLTLIEACLSGGIDNLILPPIASGLIMLAMQLF